MLQFFENLSFYKNQKFVCRFIILIKIIFFIILKHGVSMNKKLKLGTLLCAIGLAFIAMSNTSLLAETQLNACLVIEGKNTNVSITCSGYTRNDDGTITLYPPWHFEDGNGGSQTNTKNSGTFKTCPIAVKDGNGNPLPPSPIPIGVIIKPGSGEVLLQSNQLVSSQIIDHSTGGVVGTTTVNGNGSVSTGTLEAGKTYSIISTNNVGEATSNTFMLSNDKQIWISK